MIQALTIGGAVVATAALLAVPTSSFSAESKKPSGNTKWGDVTLKGGKTSGKGVGEGGQNTFTHRLPTRLKAKGSTKQGDGAIRTFNLMNSFPQK